MLDEEKECLIRTIISYDRISFVSSTTREDKLNFEFVIRFVKVFRSLKSLENIQIN